MTSQRAAIARPRGGGAALDAIAGARVAAEDHDALGREQRPPGREVVLDAAAVLDARVGPLLVHGVDRRCPLESTAACR